MRVASKYLVAVIVALLLVIGAGLVSVKLQRDYARKDAIEQLRVVGFGGRLSWREGVGATHQFVAPARTLSNTEMDRVLASLQVIDRDQHIESVDFTKSSIAQQKLASVQNLLPECDVRH